MSTTGRREGRRPIETNQRVRITNPRVLGLNPRYLSGVAEPVGITLATAAARTAWWLDALPPAQPRCRACNGIGWTETGRGWRRCEDCARQVVPRRRRRRTRR